MIRFAPLLALAATVASPVALAPIAHAQQGELAAVQAHLRAVDSMTADFSQTDRNGKVLNGTLMLKKPGKIRFQYEKGVPILIVGDGKAIWFLDYSVGQRSRWPIADSPLGVLIDPDRDIARYAKVVPGTSSDILSVEAYDPKRPEYGRITLIFSRQASAPGGLMLQGWVALDSQKNRTTVRLSNQRFNVSVSDSMFKFNDPRRGTRRN